MSDTDEAAKTETAAPAAARLDPRRNAYRPDLAAESLYGKVSAPRYVQGYPAQVVRASVPLRSRPSPTFGFETEALFGETVTVYDEREGWAWVQLERDRYVGYVPSDALSPDIDEPTHRVTRARHVRLSGARHQIAAADASQHERRAVHRRAAMSVSSCSTAAASSSRAMSPSAAAVRPTSSSSPSASSARRTCGAAARASASTARASCS